MVAVILVDPRYTVIHQRRSESERVKEIHHIFLKRNKTSANKIRLMS